MEQKLMHVMAGENESKLAADLVDAGFKVAPSGRQSRGLHVRVRTGTQDEATVKAITARAAPSATFGPNASPTANIERYRDGF